MRSKWNAVRLLFFFAVFIVYASKVPQLIGSALGNRGMLVYLEKNWRENSYAAADDMNYESVRYNANLDFTFNLLQQAVRLNRNSTSLKWGLIRLALETNRVRDVVPLIDSIPLESVRNPGLYQDVLLLYSVAGHHHDVITIYESASPPHATQTIRDVVALSVIETKDQNGAARVKELRPDDLYATYTLWKAAKQAGQNQRAARLHAEMRNFSASALRPSDPRLLDYTTEVIPELLADGIWDRGTVANVLSFLVSKYFSADSVLDFAQLMVKAHPTEPVWSFLEAEIHHRRGSAERAKNLYQRVLELSPHDRAAKRRLTLLRDNQSVSGVSYERELPSIVADVYGLPDETVSLGSNLIANGDFEEWVRYNSRSELNSEFRPSWWRWVEMFGHMPFNDGAFVGSIEELDVFEGQRAARIDGFWREQQADLEAARAGYWHRNERSRVLNEIELLSRKSYILTFVYRTQNVAAEKSAVWLYGVNEVGPFWSGNYLLPATDGDWFRFIALGRNDSDTSVSVQPLLRLYDTGTLIIDSLTLNEVEFDSNVTPTNSPGDVHIFPENYLNYDVEQ